MAFALHSTCADSPGGSKIMPAQQLACNQTYSILVLRPRPGPRPWFRKAQTQTETATMTETTTSPMTTPTALPMTGPTADANIHTDTNTHTDTKTDTNTYTNTYRQTHPPTDTTATMTDCVKGSRARGKRRWGKDLLLLAGMGSRRGADGCGSRHSGAGRDFFPRPLPSIFGSGSVRGGTPCVFEGPRLATPRLHS